MKPPGQSLLENKDFDAFVASEGYSKIETCSEMENFILKAARRFIELNTLQSRLADDDLSLDEPHARAWAVLYETFCVSTSDLTTFFTETSDYYDLPPDEQKRLITVAQALTNSGRYPERIDQAENLITPVLSNKKSTSAGAERMISAVTIPSNVNLVLEDYSEGVVEIANLEVAEKGVGHGSKLMQNLTRAADSAGLKLMVIPAGNEGSNRNTRLIAFYERFGFVLDGELMRRNPTPAPSPVLTIPSKLEDKGMKHHMTKSIGKTIHSTLDDMRKFWQWFGNSRAVDANKKPLVVYHGTKVEFNEFKIDSAAFFTTSESAAKGFANGRNGDCVIAAYLSLQNPFVVEGNGDFWDDVNIGGMESHEQQTLRKIFGPLSSTYTTEHIAESVKKSGLGFDGVIFKNIKDVSTGQVRKSTVYAAFWPHQIKVIQNMKTLDQTAAVTPEMEVAYAKAIEANNKREIIRLLERAAGVVEHDAGSGHDVDHDAPSPGENSGAPLYDIARSGIYPEDVYGPDSLRHYGSGNDLDQEALSIIRRLEAHPNMMLTVYRAVPSSVTSINPGDWVTTVRQYAKNHGEAELEPGFKILKKSVKARDLFTSGNSWLEFGYHPQDFKPEPPRTDAAKARSLSEQASIFRQGRPNSVGPKMETQETNTTLEPHQRQAILGFAHKHGRTWKDELAMCWLSASYRGCDPDQAAALQQVRNQAGPSWLNTVNLKALQSQEAQHRLSAISGLRNECGAKLTFWKKCQEQDTLTSNSPWAQIEENSLRESILDHGQQPHEAAFAICAISPGAVTNKRMKEIHQLATDLSSSLTNEPHAHRSEHAPQP